MASEWSTRAISSMARHTVVRSASAPPYSSGNARPKRPSSPIARTVSTGKTWSRSHASAFGAISDSAKSRTTRRNDSCSSDSSKSTSETYAAQVVAPDALAVLGGRLFTEATDVTCDLTALDGSGLWAVVLPFAGEPVCVRFASVRAAVPWPGRPWRGPDPASWTTSLDRAAFCSGVDSIRRAIAAGDVYQVNLTRRMSAPLPDDADVAALGAALAEGNPAPYSAVVRAPSLGLHIASASPELFLAREGGRVCSSPIKGTAA